MKNLKFYILLIFAICLIVLTVIFAFQKSADYKQSIQLMKENDSLRLVSINQKKHEIDSLKIIVESDKQKIEMLEKNLFVIEKQKQKIINDYEKSKNDIIAASDSDDWKWFNIRFPKQR